MPEAAFMVRLSKIDDYLVDNLCYLILSFKDEVKQRVDELCTRFRIGNLTPKPLKKWVYDVNAIDLSRLLHLF
jgi:hypothetical protein